MTLADRTREHGLEHYVNPVRVAGEREVEVPTGDVHDGMGLSNRVPAVCGALGTEIFLDMARLRLLARTGQGQGMNAMFRYAILS